jgi:predicted MPP superfamily phosphohydrolase
MAWRIIFFFIMALIIEIYFFQAIKTAFKNSIKTTKRWIWRAYYLTSIISLIYILIALIIPISEWPKFFRVYVTSFLFIIVFSKMMGLPFLIADDFWRAGRWTVKKISKSNYPINRKEFLSKAAILFAGIPFATMLYGMIKGAFEFKIFKEKIISPKFPSAFNGLKIVQISDLHLGSFTSAEPLEKAIDLINQQEADYILFTGDLVNEKTDEAYPFIETLKKLKAKNGIFSVLGNHDYGDYIQWPSDAAKQENLKAMHKVHSDLGWKLLLNEHQIIEKDGEKIAVIGVENWGMGRFPKYGKLDIAYKGTENISFKILLSHDPSHWDNQIKKEFKDINLTLSGHTHGMQFGVEIPGFKWSPVQYVYKQWAGLYEENNQLLYVNRGLGFIGYAGRVGIMPEITVLEFYNSEFA